MITRVEIDGFKSLQDFAVDLEPFTVFIGPNSAGKSNLLEALALLSRLASQPIASALKGGRGRPSDQFTRGGKDGSAARTMRFAVEALVRTRAHRISRCRYELTIVRAGPNSGAERLVNRGEQITAIPRESDPWLERHPDFAEIAVDTVRGDDVLPIEPGISAIPEVEDSRAWTLLSQFTQGEAFSALRDDLKRLRFVRPDAAQLGEASDRLDSGDLAPDASNLPSVLAELSPPELGELRADLVALVPGIASFEVVPDGEDLLRIDFELSGGERMPARLVSDGTLRLLLLLTALHLSPRPSLIGIEEPENGIYPGRLRALLEHVRAATTRRDGDLLPTQILITTHSPVILAALRNRPEHLRFVDMVRRDGHRLTRAREVGAAPERARATISLREIDLLLHAAHSEDP